MHRIIYYKLLFIVIKLLHKNHIYMEDKNIEILEKLSLNTELIIMLVFDIYVCIDQILVEV